MLMRNPYNNGGVIRKDSGFYNRNELLADWNTLDSGAYYLKGNRRIGKTSFLRSIERIMTANPDVLPVYFSLEGAQNAEEIHRFFLEALQNACRHKKMPRYEAPEGFIEALSASVRHFNDQGMHYLLLIDEAENLMKLPGETLTILHRELVNMHDRLTVILSGTNRLQQLYQKTQDGVIFLGNFQTRVIGCFSREDAEALIRQIKNEGGEVKVSQDVTKQILRYAGTHPFLIQKLCHSLFQYGSLRELKPEEDLVLDAQLSSFFDIDFDQLDAEHQQVLLQFRWDEGLSAEKIKGTPNISRSRTILRELEQLGFLRSENGVYWVGNYFLGLWLSERDDKPPLLELPQLLELAKRKRLNWENFFLFTAIHGARVSEAEAREFFHNALDKVFKQEFYFNTNAESIVNQIKQDMQPLPDRLRHVWVNLLYLHYGYYEALFDYREGEAPSPHIPDYYPIVNLRLRVQINQRIRTLFPGIWTTRKDVWTYERWMQGENEENFHQSYYSPNEMTFLEPEMPQEELDKIKQAKKDAAKAHVQYHFEELKKELDVRIKDYKSPLDAFQSELKSLRNILAGEKDNGDLNGCLRYIVSLFNRNPGLKQSYEDWSVKSEDWLAQRVMPRHIEKIDNGFLEPYIFAIDKYRKHMEDSIRDTNGAHSKKIIRIFLASSEELADERKKLRNFISEKNDRYQEMGAGIYLKLENWEAMSTAMAAKRKQDDYNQRILESDFFVCLVHTKVGKYTEEEFDLAWATFQQTGKPHLFTYFKKDAIDPDAIQPTRSAFKNKLEKTLHHFPDYYTGYAELEGKIYKELENLLRPAGVKEKPAQAPPADLHRKNSDSSEIAAAGIVHTARPDLNALDDALNNADFASLLALLDNHFSSRPTTQYSTLRQHIEHALSQGMMPNPATVQGLKMLIGQLKKQ